MKREVKRLEIGFRAIWIGESLVLLSLSLSLSLLELTGNSAMVAEVIVEITGWWENRVILRFFDFVLVCKITTVPKTI